MQPEAALRLEDLTSASLTAVISKVEAARAHAGGGGSAEGAFELLTHLQGRMEEHVQMRTIQRHVPHLHLDGCDMAAKTGGVLEIASNAGRAAASTSASDRPGVSCCFSQYIA